MTNIDASIWLFRQLNAAVRDCAGDAAVTGCSGQRFIGAGLERGKHYPSRESRETPWAPI